MNSDLINKEIQSRLDLVEYRIKMCREVLNSKEYSYDYIYKMNSHKDEKFFLLHLLKVLENAEK